MSGKTKRLLALCLVAAMAVAAAGLTVWPSPPDSGDNAQDFAVASLLRQPKPDAFLGSDNWYGSLVADQVRQLPLYGHLVHFYIVDGIDGGRVGMIMLAMPDHHSNNRIWIATLSDATRMADAVFTLCPGIDELYIFAGFDVQQGEPCNSGCSDHFITLFAAHVHREQFYRPWPLPGTALINDETWWDEYMFTTR